MQLMNKEEKAAYVETLVEKERPDRQDGWRKYYMQDNYIKFRDGVIKLHRQGIESEFWYDDEYDSPLTDDENQRKAYFIAENNRRFRDWGISEWLELDRQLKETGCCLGKRVDVPFVAKYSEREQVPVFLMNHDERDWYEASGVEFIPMTDEEREQLIAIVDCERERFNKRLETYWKRYSHKVCARGYWANR